MTFIQQSSILHIVTLLTALLLMPGMAGSLNAQSVNPPETPTPSPALLVGEKSGARMAIVSPESLEFVAQVPANPNPHDIATDGTYAYVSNSGARSITVIDLESQQQVEGIDMRPLSPTHGLWVAQGKLYFANEQSRTRSEEHTSELQSRGHLVCRLLLEKK